MKKIFIILLLINTQAYHAEEKDYYFVDASKLNVRSGPNLSSQKIGQLKRSQQVNILKVTDYFNKIDNKISPWIEIELPNNAKGFVFGAYIKKKISRYGTKKDTNTFILKSYDYTQLSFTIKGMTLLKETPLYEYPSNKSKILDNLNVKSVANISARSYTSKSIGEKSFWYSVNHNGQTGYINGENLIIDPVLKNGIYYGVISYPVGIEEPFEYDYIQTNSKLIVFSNITNSIIQTFFLPDVSDSIKILTENKFKKVIPGTIVINHNWNHFTCCPIGYSGNLLYKLDDKGKISSLVFSWFNEIGAQDEPWAKLKTIRFKDSSVSFDYEYYDSIGLPALGYGNFELFYSLKKGSLELTSIKSNVKKTHQFVDHSYSKDDKHKLIKSEIMQFTKESLNEKFKYMSKVYKFVY